MPLRIFWWSCCIGLFALALGGLATLQSERNPRNLDLHQVAQADPCRAGRC